MLKVVHFPCHERLKIKPGQNCSGFEHFQAVVQILTNILVCLTVFISFWDKFKRKHIRTKAFRMGLSSLWRHNNSRRNI